MKKAIRVFVLLGVFLIGFNSISRSEENCVTFTVSCIPGHGDGGYIMICYSNEQECEDAIDEAIDVMCP